MDNDAIEALLKYEPPWRSELVKWREKQKALLSSAASAAAPNSAVEPEQDIGWYTILVCLKVTIIFTFAVIVLCMLIID